jgi:hypothetical protein
MAYSIYKSDGSFLTSIADGTINTTSTSVGLPGRNYAGYGQIQDTSFVHIIENFASNTVPDNPLTGQLWYDTSAGVMKVCPTDGESNAAAWVSIAQSGGSGNTTFGNVSVNGNLSGGNIYANSGTIGAANVTTGNLTVTINATIGNANITVANIGTTNTALITTGANTTPGNIFGTWTITGGNAGTSLAVANGNIRVSNATAGIGILCDNFYYSNGTPISFAGSYGNSNVQSYLPTYNGNVGGGTATFVGTSLTTGAAGTSGTITGTWSLVGASRLQATYADLAERFAADDVLEPGTVVEIGGEAEITAVKYELSEDVFGVVSNTAAYLMNSGAGSDETHPPIAVSGRVEVKVTGKVKKGQRLVSAGNGTARAAKDGEATAFNTIGRALTDKTSEGLGFVEAIVMIR